MTEGLEIARPLMESRKHQVEVILPDETIKVEGGPNGVANLLLNLLSNARAVWRASTVPRSYAAR